MSPVKGTGSSKFFKLLSEEVLPVHVSKLRTLEYGGSDKKDSFATSYSLHFKNTPPSDEPIYPFIPLSCEDLNFRRTDIF